MKKGLVHCIAKCDDCEWTEEYYMIAKTKGIKHSKITGHNVNVQEGLSIDYKNGKKVL